MNDKLKLVDQLKPLVSSRTGKNITTTFVLNPDAVSTLESKAKEFQLKKTELGRIAVNFAINSPEFWELVKELSNKE